MNNMLPIFITMFFMVVRIKYDKTEIFATTGTDMNM